MAPQTAISKAVCYKTKNEQLWEKAVHFLLVATNCFYAGLPTVFCTITTFGQQFITCKSVCLNMRVQACTRYLFYLTGKGENLC